MSINISYPSTDSLNTPLHLAGEAGKAKCFNCLLQHDSDLEAENVNGDTAFICAKKAGHKLATEKASKILSYDVRH